MCRPPRGSDSLHRRKRPQRRPLPWAFSAATAFSPGAAMGEAGIGRKESSLNARCGCGLNGSPRKPNIFTPAPRCWHAVTPFWTPLKGSTEWHQGSTKALFSKNPPTVLRAFSVWVIQRVPSHLFCPTAHGGIHPGRFFQPLQSRAGMSFHLKMRYFHRPKMRDQVDAGRLSGVGPKPTRRVHPPAWSWIFSTPCWIVFNGVLGFANVRRSFLATLPHPHFFCFFLGVNFKHHLWVANSMGELH